MSRTRPGDRSRTRIRATPADGSWWDETGFWYGLHTLLDPARVPFFRAALEELRVETPRVLDVGSGGGFVSVGIGDMAHVTAVDVSGDAVLAASEAGVPTVVVADAGRLPFNERTFDAVVCSEVLEHVADPEALIAEAALVTVPGGLFLFSTPVRSLWSRLIMIEAAQRWRPTRVLPPNLHDWNDFLTRKELIDLLDRNGFRLREIAGIGVHARGWPKMLLALMLLKMGRVGFAEAGGRIDLAVTRSTQIAMIGFAERVTSR